MVRVMQIAFLVFAVGLLWLTHRINPQGGPPAEPAVYESFAALAVADGFIGILVQRLMLKGRATPLPNGKMPTSAQRWFSANVVRLAFANSTCLFGFVLHMLGAPERLVLALMIAGMLFLLVSPGKPPAEPAQSTPYGTIG
jgi:hypothetical protein